MRHYGFQTWLARVNRLTERPRERAGAVLDKRKRADASLAGIKLRVDELWWGRHRQASRAVTRGRACSTAFRRRHRLLQGAGHLPDWLRRLVKSHETYLLHSRRGESKLDRPPRRRGCKSNKRGLLAEQVRLLMAVDRGGQTASTVLERVTASTPQDVLISGAFQAYRGWARTRGVPHGVVNLSAWKRGRGSCDIQTANGRHWRFKSLLWPTRGVASKYRDRNLHLSKQVELSSKHSPRACLAALVTTRYIRFAD